MTRVLYVEDESILAISMEWAMQAQGYTVQVAFDGDQGLDKAKNFHPEIIVTDFMMPRMDGHTMVRKLRQAGIGAPVIVTTAVPRENLDQQFLNQIDDYLGKPFTEPDLIAALRRVLNTELDKSPPD